MSGTTADSVTKPAELSPDSLVRAVVSVFILGLMAIAVLIGVMKQVAGFDLSVILAVSMFSFVLMLAIEGVLVRLLLSGKRGAKGTGDAGRPKEQTTKGLGEVPARVLPEPVPSVTEHTTRAFEPIYGERKLK